MGKTQGLQLGVLIIGSLYWDCSKIRTKWRQDRLCLKAKQHVKVPIRYGRRSSSRGNSYTMVFSMNLVHENRCGQAIVAPCQQLVSNSEGLVKEAKYLWAAESNEKYSADISTCKSWGRIVLLENPKRLIPDEIRRGWCNHILSNTYYEKEMGFADSKDIAVDESGGFLRTPWPKLRDGSDLETDILLATVTDPEIDKIGDYPSSQTIAQAWNTCKGKKYIDYFCKNRAYGIKTAQDVEIQDQLCELW